MQPQSKATAIVLCRWLNTEQTTRCCTQHEGALCVCVAIMPTVAALVCKVPCALTKPCRIQIVAARVPLAVRVAAFSRVVGVGFLGAAARKAGWQVGRGGTRRVLGSVGGS